MNHQIIVMNFSGVYEKQNFYRRRKHFWLECKNVRGTNCYCDEYAKEELRKMIKEYPPSGIHFIDSGNYHYMSKLWMDKIKEPFSLLLFDHHTDMRPAAFTRILSCGSWVKEALDKNPYMRKAYLIGVNDEHINSALKEYPKRLVWLSEKEFADKNAWEGVISSCKEEALYVSLDKDVLNKRTVITNWDQGNNSLDTLLSFFREVKKRKDIIGIDICGEYEYTVSYDNIKAESIYKRHNEVNEILLEEVASH